MPDKELAIKALEIAASKNDHHSDIINSAVDFYHFLVGGKVLLSKETTEKNPEA